MLCQFKSGNCHDILFRVYKPLTPFSLRQVEQSVGTEIYYTYLLNQARHKRQGRDNKYSIQSDIDGRPAFDVYSRWPSCMVSGQMPTRESVQRVDSRILRDVLYITLYRHCELPHSTVVNDHYITLHVFIKVYCPTPTKA